MIYTENIRKALVTIELMCRGRYDKGDYPYIHHVMHIAESCNSEDATIVALWHDLFEDKMTFDSISNNYVNILKLDIEKSDDVYEILKGYWKDTQRPLISNFMFCRSILDSINMSLVHLYNYGMIDEAISFMCTIYKYNKEIEQALKAITRNKNEAYRDYIMRLRNNDIARQVKLADIEHNMNTNRLNGGSSNKSLIERYIDAKYILTSGI